MTIPPVPTDPTKLTLDSFVAGHDFDTYAAAWQARDAAQQALIASLSSRYPGDPGNGRMYVGAATPDDTSLVSLEHDAGRPAGVNRNYWRTGPSDLAVPAAGQSPAKGTVAWQIVADHTFGRVPVVSIKLDGDNLGSIATGRFDGALVPWIRWCDAQPLPIDVIANHEAENNYKGDAGNSAAMAKHAADFRADQQHIAALIAQTVGTPRRLAFGGCTMSYTWTAQGTQRWGDPRAWYPGDGVWRFWALDHYPSGTTALTPEWVAAADYIKGLPLSLAVGELGFHSTDAAAVTKLAQIVVDLIARDADFLAYWDSADFVMAGGLRAAYTQLMSAPWAAHPVG